MTKNAAAKVYEFVFKVARKRWRLNIEDARDAASEAIMTAIEKGQLTAPFAINVLHYHMLNAHTQRKRRKTHLFSEDDDPVDLLGATPPVQFARLVATECAIAIEGLPETFREVMRLTALQYSPREIEELLGFTENEVRWRLSSGRKIMRDHDLYEIGRTRGQHKFIGVRKHKGKWEARICNGAGPKYIGLYNTATDAAFAYDAEARKLGKQKLNFPVALCALERNDVEKT